jgi:hypothetical protein
VLFNFNLTGVSIMNAFKTAIAFAAITAAMGAQAATDSAQLELRGSVAVNCTIEVKPTAKATSLDIINGEQQALVGTVTENCNSGTGYTVHLTSSNQGQLLSTAVGAKPAVYEAAYDDGQGAIGKEIVASRQEAQFGRQGALTVSFAGDKQAIAGVYSDIVNLVIKAK